MASQKKTYILIGALLLLSVSFFVLNTFTSAFTFPADYEAPVDSSKVATVVNTEKPIIKFGIVVNGLELKEGYVKRDQLFADILEENFVSPSVLQQLHLLPKKIFDFRKIATSKKYTLISQLDSLKTVVAFIYEPSPVEYVVLHLKDSS